MTRIWRTRLLVAALFAAAAFLLFIGMPAAIDRDAPDAATPVQAAEEDADDMEAALAIEQSKQDAMQAIQYQLSKPFADFTEAYETTIRERQEKAVLLVQAIVVPGDCNVGGLAGIATAPDEFVRSRALKDGRNELEATRAKLVEDARTLQLELSSDAPPIVTDDVVGLMDRTVQQIGTINADYAQFCTDAQRKISELPASDGANMMALSTSLQGREAEAARQIEQIIETMNSDVDAVDTVLVNWLADPVRRAMAN